MRSIECQTIGRDGLMSVKANWVLAKEKRYEIINELDPYDYKNWLSFQLIIIIIITYCDAISKTLP